MTSHQYRLVSPIDTRGCHCPVSIIFAYRNTGFRYASHGENDFVSCPFLVDASLLFASFGGLKVSAYLRPIKSCYLCSVLTFGSTIGLTALGQRSTYLSAFSDSILPLGDSLESYSYVLR